MSNSVYKFTLDIHSTQSQISLPVVLGDTSRSLLISLSENGNPYVLEDGSMAVFTAKKPDDTSLFNSCVILNNRIVQYDFTNQTASAAGLVDCQLRIYNTNETLIASPRFSMVVDSEVIYDDDVPISEDERTAIDNMMTAEAIRIANEAIRVTNEINRTTAENGRVTAEGLRVSAETGRANAEDLRVSAESGRVSAESGRVSAESGRVSAESGRVSAEALRAAAEGGRVSAESGRVSAENGRVSAEAARVAAENARKGVWVAYSENSDGTDYTTTWSSGQNYIGVCNAHNQPTSKTDYTWALFKGETGNGISSVAYTSSSGVVDTYTITFTNGDTTTFTVTNGTPLITVGGTGVDVLAFSSDPQGQLDANKKRLANLESVLQGNIYTLTSGASPAYTQTVDTNAQKYADIQMIGGKTLAFNQLIGNGNFTSTTGWTTSNTNLTVANNIGYVKRTSDVRGVNIAWTNIQFVKGHKYFYTVTMLSPKNNSYLINGEGASGGVQIKAGSVVANEVTTISGIYTNQNLVHTIRFFYNRDTALSADDVVEYSNIMVTDLTQMFGEGNEPTTAADFKAIFPNDYYGYDFGSFINAKCDSVISKDSSSTQIAEYEIPAYIQALYGYGWSTGSVYNEIDFVNKKFIQRIERVDMGTLEWTYDTTLISVPVFISPHLPSAKKDSLTSFLAPQYIYVGGRSSLPNYDKALGRYNGTSSADAVCIRDDSYTDATAFTAAVDGKYLYYELGTPREIDLSEYLTDDNYIVTAPGGSLTFSQQDGTLIKLPNTVKYMVKIVG